MHSTTKELVDWLHTINRKDIEKLLSHESQMERQRTTQSQATQHDDQPTYQCDFTGCQQKFQTHSSMRTHYFHKHKQKHPTRSLVISKQCPGCKQDFKSERSAKDHFQHHCSKRIPPQQLQDLQQAHQDFLQQTLNPPTQTSSRNNKATTKPQHRIDYLLKWPGPQKR